MVTGPEAGEILGRKLLGIRLKRLDIFADL